jgi:hypothetical protein
MKVKDFKKSPAVKAIISVLKGRNDVGKVKEGVNLLGIVEKLTQKREERKETSGEGPGDSSGK